MRGKVGVETFGNTDLIFGAEGHGGGLEHSWAGKCSSGTPFSFACSNSSDSTISSSSSSMKTAS